MNPKVIGFVALLCIVSGTTFWLTREYSESHPITDIANAPRS